MRKARSEERAGGGDVEMTIYELRQAVSEYAIMWIQKDDGEYCEANESRYLSHKWDGEAVKTMYPEKVSCVWVHGNHGCHLGGIKKNPLGRAGRR